MILHIYAHILTHNVLVTDTVACTCSCTKERGADRTSISASKAAAVALSPAVKKPCNWLQGPVRAPSAKPVAVEASAALACKGFV